MWEGTSPRVFTTNSNEPESGRTFVWTKMGWFERVESATENGAIEFSPVADSEDELRSWLMTQNLEIDEIDDDIGFAVDVKDEITNTVPLYPEAEEESLSDRDP
jgi:hypothetical protein